MLEKASSSAMMGTDMKEILKMDRSMEREKKLTQKES